MMGVERGDAENHENIPMAELNMPLVEDEHGYVDPTAQSAMISKDIIMQLPSHNFDDVGDEVDGACSYNTQRRNKTLKRSETRCKTMKLKRVTIRSTSLDDDVEKVYGILTSDPDMEEDEIRANLREMHQSLTLKRMVKARIETDNQEKNRLKPLDCWSRFSSRIAVSWHEFVYGLKNLSYSLELWHTHMKKIQGHYGAGVASYFIFLRWLLYLNIFNFILSFCFIFIPHLVFVNSGGDDATNSANDSTHDGFSGYDLLTGSGWIGNSGFYYGRYTNETIQVSEGYFYSMPYAYLFTVGVAAIVNLIVVAYSLTTAYQANYVDSSGEMKSKVCGKIFCAWDYSIEKPDTAELRHRLIYHELKATLSSVMDKKGKKSACREFVEDTISLFVNLFVFCVIGAIGYLVYYILDSKVVEVKIRILKKMTLSLTITVISFFFHYLISYATSWEYYLSKKTQLYFTLSRVTVLRIVILGILIYFWMVIYVPGPGDMRCYESLLGQEIYRLIVINFLPNLLLCTFCGEFLRNMLRKIFLKSVQKAEFDIAYNTNDLIYYQTLVWVGAFYGPLLPLLLLIILVLLFYAKMNSLFYNCRPTQKPWSTMEVQVVFLVLALTNFLLAAMAVAYVIFRTRPSTVCGPFRGHETMYELITESLTISNEDSFVFAHLYHYARSPAFLLAIVIAVSTGVYWAKRHASLQEKVVKQLRQRLVMESKDKVFLLRLFESAYREHMRKCSAIENSAAATNHDDWNGAPKELMNESYVEYHQHCVPDVKTKYDPGYLLASVPVNQHSAMYNAGGNTSVEAKFRHLNNAEGSGRRPSGTNHGDDSSSSTEKELQITLPAHKQGFQYLVRGEIPPRSQPKSS